MIAGFGGFLNIYSLIYPKTLFLLLRPSITYSLHCSSFLVLNFMAKTLFWLIRPSISSDTVAYTTGLSSLATPELSNPDPSKDHQKRRNRQNPSRHSWWSSNASFESFETSERWGEWVSFRVWGVGYWVPWASKYYSNPNGPSTY